MGDLLPNFNFLRRSAPLILTGVLLGMILIYSPSHTSCVSLLWDVATLRRRQRQQPDEKIKFPLDIFHMFVYHTDS
jgi:hypothetical protein